MRHLALLALLVTACGASDDATDDTDPVDSDVTDTSAPDDTDTDCADDVPTDGASLVVTIEDLEGNPLGPDQVQLRYCRGVSCAFPQCAQGNTQTIGGLDGGVGSLEIAPSGSGVGLHATPFAPYTLAADAEATLVVKVPPAPTSVDLPTTRAKVQLTDGLWVTVGAGDLDGATPLDPDPTEIGAVDATDVTLPIEGLDGEVLAVWYMEPFDAKATNPLDVTLTNTWGLFDGEAELYVGDYTTSAWIKVGDLDAGVVSAVSTPPESFVVSGLERVSTLVVVRKSVAR